MKNVAIIPARGGSKRIKKKNIKAFCGSPIISYSISAAIKSNLFDRILVSTDDNEIAEVALSFGAEVPFVRPKNISDDQTGTIPVIKHAINWLDKSEPLYEFEYACCIYPTAPFVTAVLLRSAFNKLVKENANFSMPVTKFDYPVQRALYLSGSKNICMVDEKLFTARSQDLEDRLHDTGQFYWGKKSAWLSKKTLFGSSSVPVIIPSYQCHDIDTVEDWQYAEMKYKLLGNLK